MAFQPGLLERVAAIDPQMFFLTGDVTTTSLEEEFLDVAEFLKPLSDRFEVRLVPGNHNRYTRGAARCGRVEQLMDHLLPKSFPHHEKLGGRWHLLALDAAHPNLVSGTGRIGQSQLATAVAKIRSLDPDEGIVMLCHYPVCWPPQSPLVPWHTRLSDASSLNRLVDQCPAQLIYLHGHIHRPWFWQPKNDHPNRPTHVNAGAPCLPTARYPDGQGFWQIDLPTRASQAVRYVHHVPCLDCNGRKRRRRTVGRTDGLADPPRCLTRKRGQNPRHGFT